MAREATPQEDMEIIERVLAGDGRAYEDLVERHKARVARIVAGKVPAQDGPEVVHEVFIRAFVSLAGYRPQKPFSHWLSTLAVRACHDFWRERYRRRDSAEAAMPLDLAERREGPGQADDQYQTYEAWELLDWALGHLSAGDRMAVTLVHLEGWSQAEAAAALGWSETVLKVRAFRARRKLRKIIAGSLFLEVAGEDA